MEPEAAAQLERRHVHEVYESTAAYFSDLQGKAWPRVRQFLLEQKPGSLVADIGCGTGKYLRVNSQVYKLGCDYCGPLVDIAHSRGCEVLVCDNLRLPFRDRSFDAIISIGVIHHFSTAQRRTRAIQEMARVLAPGGQVMIYVWAMEKNHRHFDKQDVFIPWNPALCSQLLAEPAPSGRKRVCGQPRATPDGPPCRLACSVCGCPVYLEKRQESQRSHSLDGSGPPGCCRELAEVRDGDSGFYSILGKSFRSWFFSQSLDECTLKEHVEKAEHATEEWALGHPVSVQPSKFRHLDLGDQEPLSQEQGDAIAPGLTQTPEWPLPTVPHKDTHSQQQGGCFLRQSTVEHSCRSACPGGTGKQATSQLWKRSSLPPPFISLAAAMSTGASQAEAPGSGALTRYYHVFREGELCCLVEQHVPELRVLSSINDHGNWCIVAEKKPGMMAC
ncbi:putative tRNA methyltransferase 9B [Phascolarctos cinereus]|uniref:Probable tRNA methyltransferase 9B n=1 Tax=Phascolarctos cinereus TaxID=38626 RepID=A0A6P5JVV1_PHACI|nr:probable tRNA methyltransferase 9-like protein [Phascolarctos cinereus]XP_020835275.1 probable tRNA methyltransferase 9-like protein [Phascolarctos cinereus]